ncbi:UDP-N-acetylmuramoyl-tripeptide--D-alanyl-D-alanine ligase [Gemmobacter tilapiae]|uniref:UDP-N-acetylmuramoyl-tripeptide--D-alanyl-D-alanine ligase n=2 Tax=Neogemmobacter tilapiae TaxID=875041 RepID=A0A918TUC3_9RHOB|nr:UDP-N-acetylmuramoyl-tripeptide--D-alanyl-D-alanine ligase [Gemmobacter tilapiae]
MALWTAQDAAAATGGQAVGDWQANGLSIDTRSLQKGDLFIALKDQRDGHDFVAQALAKGAAAALVTHRPEGVAEDAPLLIVPDVLQALEALARAARARTSAKIIGVTGSVGKTSTKDMLGAMLSGQGKTHIAAASFNNHWGVPLTLARMPQDADFAVIEIGMNHPGEIAPLARLARPHVAIITIVAPAHLEAFASVAEIAHEKAAIFDGLEPGGTAILRGDLETSAILLDAARAKAAKVLTFGEESGDYTLSDLRIGPEASCARLRAPQGERLFKVGSPGRHFAVNALAVLATGDVLGLDPTIAAHDLGRWQPPAGRGTRERIMVDPIEDRFFDLIDDAFNANPASMAASLAVLAAAEPTHGVGSVGKGRRVAILGDMLELGPQETALHQAIAALPALRYIDVIHCVGPRMKALYASLPQSKRGDWVETATELVPKARRLFDAGDILLVKGSKGIKVSLVVDALRKLGQSQPPRMNEAE